MSVGHLDHVLTVYSSMEHVTWRSFGPMCALQELLQLIHWGDMQEVRSEDQGAQEKVDFFTAGTQTQASRARESSVTHKSAITDHAVEENHVIDWDKAKVVDREAQ